MEAEDGVERKDFFRLVFPGVRRAVGFCLFCGLVGSTSFSASAAEAFPPAQDILRKVRLGHASQDMRLVGRIREKGKKVPFELIASPGSVEYRFENPLERYVLRIGETESTLLGAFGRGGALRKLSDEELESEIREMGVSAGELSLDFLYWPSARVEDEQIVKTRKCWVLRLEAPRRTAPYAVVFVWVDQESGALLRMEGSDWNGRLRRRFEVVSGRKVDGQWMLKRMRIEMLAPDREKVLRRI